MRIYLGIDAVEQPTFGGTYAELELHLYGTKEEAESHHHYFLVHLDHTDLPPHQNYILAMPTTPKKYEEWYEHNHEWINSIQPIAFPSWKHGLLTPVEMHPPKKKKEKA